MKLIYHQGQYWNLNQLVNICPDHGNPTKTEWKVSFSNGQVFTTKNKGVIIQILELAEANTVSIS